MTLELLGKVALLLGCVVALDLALTLATQGRKVRLDSGKRGDGRPGNDPASDGPGSPHGVVGPAQTRQDSI